MDIRYFPRLAIPRRLKAVFPPRAGFCYRDRLGAVLLAVLCMAVGSSWGQLVGGVAAEKIVSESGFQGGLIVQVGLKDADLAMALGKETSTLVHGLVRDPEALAGIRSAIQDSGLYGRVSAVAWSGPYLPYADVTVNLLLLLDETVELAGGEADRVLALRGVACTVKGKSLSIRHKERPADIDEWHHSRYDATGNAVSKDKRVGPPNFMRWEAWPRWNHGTKTSCLVSMGGRIFYILDDAHFATNARTWSLIARDASNGIQLWRHQLPSWAGSRGGKKVGPAQVHRRLIAENGRVYVTLGEFAPVSILDAASGDVIRILEATERATEMLLSDGVLVVLTEPITEADVRRGSSRVMKIAAYQVETGSQLWEHTTELVLPLSMAADPQQVVYHDGRAIQSLALRTGTVRWTSAATGQKLERRSQSNSDRPGAEKGTIVLAPQFAPSMLIYENVVAFAGGCQLNVFSASDGAELWRADYAASNYSVPVEIFGFGGYLWGPDSGMNVWSPKDDNIDFNAYDPMTGAITKSVKGDYGYRFQHHRCHQMKVVDGRVISARAGIEFLDTETNEVNSNHWIRGSCYYGIMPANGLLYAPPHNCACYIRAKLSGFMALSTTKGLRTSQIADGDRLQKGPAYGNIVAGGEVKPTDWPTYRHDAARSGSISATVGSELLLGWQTSVGGKLTSPVVADGRLYVASTDTHRLFAINAQTSELLWDVTLDGRIDSPPTIYQGLVLCGCRDGSVSALRAADGALVWRFLAAPEERYIVCRGQLESVWPVHGSVLVQHGLAYFAAGKSSYLDGGIRLYGLDPHTGSKRVDQVLWTRDETGAELMDEESVEGFLNDILSSDGERIFMRHQVMDLMGKPKAERVSHLHGPDGFLSWDTTSRLLWTYAPVYTSRHQGAFYDIRLNRAFFPSGRILVEGEDTIYGFGQNHYKKLSPDPGGEWGVFASPKKTADGATDLTAREYHRLARRGEMSATFGWVEKVPIQVWGLVKTDDVLFAAGPPGRSSTTLAALNGEIPGKLLAISLEDGKILADMSLPSAPVWDGLAVADGNLYAVLANGDVVCLWSVASGKSGTPLTATGWAATLPPVQADKEPGLLGHWRFDEAGGMVARDCSKFGHHAEVTGGWAEGDFGTCLATDGNPQVAIIPDAEHLHFGTENFTLAIWVKVDAYKARIIGKEAFPQNWWVINLTDDGKAELVLGEGRGEGKSVRVKTSAPLATDAWTHLVAVADRKAGEVTWFVNGKADTKAVFAKNMTGGLTGGAADISIPSTYRPLRGLVGDLRLYSTALDVERIAGLFGERSAALKKTTITSRK